MAGLAERGAWHSERLIPLPFSPYSICGHTAHTFVPGLHLDTHVPIWARRPTLRTHLCTRRLRSRFPLLLLPGCGAAPDKLACVNRPLQLCPWLGANPPTLCPGPHRPEPGSYHTTPPPHAHPGGSPGSFRDPDPLGCLWPRTDLGAGVCLPRMSQGAEGKVTRSQNDRWRRRPCLRANLDEPAGLRLPRFFLLLTLQGSRRKRPPMLRRGWARPQREAACREQLARELKLP